MKHYDSLLSLLYHGRISFLYLYCSISEDHVLQLKYCKLSAQIKSRCLSLLHPLNCSQTCLCQLFGSLRAFSTLNSEKGGKRDLRTIEFTHVTHHLSTRPNPIPSLSKQGDNGKEKGGNS